MRRLSGIAFLSFFLVVMLTVAACGGGGASGGNGGGVFEELLDAIPDTPETRGFLLISDFARVREIFDIPLPDAQADQEDLEDYIIEVGGVNRTILGPRGPFISGLGNFALLQLDRAQYLAFDARNVDQSVEAGQPPGMLEVLRGRFDPDATGRVLGACSECHPPDMKSQAGISFYSWGEDLVSDLTERLAPPAYDQLGRGGRIAVLDDYVFRTVETNGMEALLDTRQGERLSLADREEFRLVAEGLAQLGAYSAFISNETQDWAGIKDDLFRQAALTEREFQSLLEKLEQFPLLRSYQVFASGIGADDTSNYMALVLVHRDSGDAKDNVARLEQRMRGASSIVTGEPWADMIDEMEINAQGRVVLAKLRGDSIANIWDDWVFRRDLFIPHE